MKYIVMLGDGMADRPVPALGGKTPLEAAYTPNMDFLAQNGVTGMARTVPEGMPPGSDTANLSVMGYDPKVYYSGRSPLEAVSMGVELAPDDVAYRCNLVTLSDTPALEDAKMVDYSAGEISTAEAAELIACLDAAFHTDDCALYAGISYRHCLVLRRTQTGSDCTPPHDLSGQPVRGHLPSGRHGARLCEMMERSRALLRDHPVNQARIARGLRPANACWFWGEGTRPALTSFEQLYGVRGGVISAVDLIKGIAICAGLDSVDVPGATGNVDTNFAGKGQAALELLQNGHDFVYIHVEAPDECGHRGEAENKVASIELIDREILGRILPALRESSEPFSVLLMPDHPTPLSIRTHTSDPVPFALYRSDTVPDACWRPPAYTEAHATSTRLMLLEGHRMMEWLLRGRFPENFSKSC
ncbi:cofactor-independent phosphoglycerate mutase [Anaerotruncus colihominis]|uniref:cofactor-independent phosphoglycerate mutase n=1 Tax=Anaerotruncus colihominis TaxID=169435 RepID=UPI0026EC35A6|nr:cofactor-independent phosphoglycerate mutase [Anaerotruncus colihominis]